jgi:hypothetical protein
MAATLDLVRSLKGIGREFHNEHHPGVEQRGQFAYDLGSKGLDCQP